jgi:hypothetical protein
VQVAGEAGTLLHFAVEDGLTACVAIKRFSRAGFLLPGDKK